MYAVVETGGKQYRVSVGDTIRVERLEAVAGDQVGLDKVLLVGGDGAVTIGTPLVAGAKVEATVKGEGRADKIVVFKRRRRKHYRKTIGHRQDFIELEITGISKGN